MKSLVTDFCELALCVYKDACAVCSICPDLRDEKTLRSRAENEGLSFLTIVLPRLSAGLETALKTGISDPLDFPNFRCRGRYPELLRGFFGLIFSKDTGCLLSSPSIPAIRVIRQISLLFKKVRIPCSPERSSAALERYEEVEHDLKVFTPSSDVSDTFVPVSRLLWADICSTFRTADLLPHHGPGATSDRLLGNKKFAHRTWPDRLDNYFPLEPNAFVISAFGSEEVKRVTILPRDQEFPAKVILVPKTLKTPRVIACEPVAMQLIQQGLKDYLVRSIESSALASGHVNFRDQSINQRLAISSSIDGQLATVDLSDASDRVPLSLVKAMLGWDEDFLSSILACRSEFAVLPGGRIIGPLLKFASMGSALCFPVESMYFYTLCVVARLRKHRLPVTWLDVFRMSRSVYVYGDDIIYPVDDMDVLLDVLQEYNCKPNTAKSFWTGRFRESCGVDSFNGEVVQPIYIREVPPEGKRSSRSLVSWSSTGNQLFNAGYPRAAEYLHRRCAGILRFYPSSCPESFPGLGRSYPFNRNRYRMNRDTHDRVTRSWVPSPIYRTDRLEGYAALQKCLTLMEARKSSHSVLDIPDVDKRHLERTARHGDVALKLRWVPIW